VRPHDVVVQSPLLYQHLGLPESVEQFSVEQLIPQAAMEALNIAVLPWAARLDIERLDLQRREPLPNLGGRKL